MKYRLADGVKAQALAVHVSEQRPGLPYAVSVRKEVLMRPGEVVDTAYDLTAWVQAGLVEVVYDPAAQFKAALPVVEPVAAPVPVVTDAAPPTSEEAPDAAGEGGIDAPSEGSAEAAPLAKAAARAARRRS